jgi:hypothetical protein
MKKARKTKPAPKGRKKKAARKTSTRRKPIMRHSKEG